MNGRHATTPVEPELQVPVTGAAPTPGRCIHTYAVIERLQDGERWRCPQCGHEWEWRRP